MKCTSITSVSLLEIGISIILALLSCSLFIYYENPEVASHPLITHTLSKVSEVIPEPIKKQLSSSKELLEINAREIFKEDNVLLLFAIISVTIPVVYLFCKLYCPGKEENNRKRSSHFHQESKRFASEAAAASSNYTDDSESEEDERSKSFREKRRTFSYQSALSLKCEMCDVQDARTERDYKFPVEIVLMNEELEVVYMQYICPDSNLIIVDDNARFHGITEHVFRKHGRSLKQVQEEVLSLVDGHLLVGHDLGLDLKALGIKHEIPEEVIRDTANARMFMTRHIKGFRSRRLPTLAWEHLGVKMHTSESEGKHDPVEDAEVVMRLYKKYKHLDWRKP